VQAPAGGDPRTGRARGHPHVLLVEALEGAGGGHDVDGAGGHSFTASTRTPSRFAICCRNTSRIWPDSAMTSAAARPISSLADLAVDDGRLGAGPVVEEAEEHHRRAGVVEEREEATAPAPAGRLFPWHRRSG
jgi:hypothetical protein